jgi:hypothetical protein
VRGAAPTAAPVDTIGASFDLLPLHLLIPQSVRKFEGLLAPPSGGIGVRRNGQCSIIARLELTGRHMAGTIPATPHDSSKNRSNELR